MPAARRAGDEDARRRVLFIGGLGRSGSTLLAVLLNSLPGFVSLGELHQVWDYQRHDLLCSCGERFRACEFWTAVGARAFGGWDEVDAKQMTELLGLV